MKFIVSGADRATGQDVAREYDARTPEAAAAFANLDGIVVADVAPALTKSTAPPPPPPPDALAYHAPSAPSPAVPRYVGLGVAAGVLRVYAILCYVFGAIALVASLLGIAGLAINGMFAANGRGTSAEAAMAAAALLIITSLGPALALIFAAAISHGLSAACAALRDIARNSWR